MSESCTAFLLTASTAARCAAWQELTWDQALDEIAAKTAVSDHHPDAREGVAAFRDKRTPKFNAWLE